MGEITSGLDASRLEAVEKERLGDVRQSYEATVKVRSCMPRMDCLITTTPI